MLGGLILENFKAFGERQELPLAPITLLFGPNGSGKSSIIQSLLLLKQTMTDVQSPRALLAPRGNLVDLGNARDLVFQRDLTRVCEITPLIRVPFKATSLESHMFWRAGAPPDLPIGIGLRAQFATDAKAMTLESLPVYVGRDMAYALQGTLKPKEPIIYVFRDGHFAEFGQIHAHHPVWEALYQQIQRELPQILRALQEELQRAAATDTDTSDSSDLYEYGQGYYHPIPDDSAFDASIVAELIDRFSNYSLDRFLEDVQSSVHQHSFALQQFRLYGAGFSPTHQDKLRSIVMGRTAGGYAGNDSDLELNADACIPNLVQLSETLWGSLRGALEQLIYLGPLREFPDRYHMSTGLAGGDLGKSGRQAWDILVSNQQAIEECNRLLAAFGTGYELRVDHYVRQQSKGSNTTERSRENSDPATLYAIQLHDTRTDTSVNIHDVGFGIGQLLPVIVQSVLARGKTIMIEQPELHLHPRLQAHLGTLFKNGIAGPQPNQYIVETHSQHVILRLQRHVREGDLDPNDVSVIYVERDRDGSHCIHLPLDARGDFVNEWPHGFFEETYRELFGKGEMP